MTKLTDKTKVAIFGTIVVAALAFASTIVYTIWLMSTGIGNRDIPDPAVDIYDQELKYDQGISAEGYEDRPLYTEDQYNADRVQIIKNLERESYDLVDDKVRQLAAKYKFEGEMLETFMALERIMVFDKESNGTIEDKLILISSLNDPEMYITLFQKLTLSEQAMLIEYPNVQILPAYNYESINWTRKVSNFNDDIYTIIGSQEYYEITMKFKGFEIIVCMLHDNYFSIFYINNATGTLEGNIYQGGY